MAFAGWFGKTPATASGWVKRFGIMKATRDMGEALQGMMNYLETEPITDGWSKRTALLGDNRLSVPIRIYAATVQAAGEPQTGLAYLLEREVEWLEPAAVLDRMFFVKQDAELQAVRMENTRAKGAK